MGKQSKEHMGAPVITRRRALEVGAKLGGTLLWTVPVIQTMNARPAFAAGSPPPSQCAGEHRSQVQAEGQACNQAGAMSRLEHDADGDADKFCKKVDTCRSGKCRFLSRGPLSNVTCTPHDDKHCNSGTRWKCVGIITSVSCQCL